MKRVLSRWWAVGLLVVLAGQAGAADDVRFSQSLNADDRAAVGLKRLSSDEVAVVDALVRRDTAARASSTNDDKAAATFSQRLTADERRIAGLPKLSAEELAKLDSFVDRHENGKLARTLLAPPVYLSRSPRRMSENDMKKEREIHGSFSLTYGWGSGGYSEKTGSMVLNFEDPAKGYSISVGYSESHTKGGNIYRDPYYYDPLRNPSPVQPGPLRP